MSIDLILGTAGHIDHGKTALVRALTGVDTDRLPEEKRRGITIELGFAELCLGEYRLGVVDVPGHERFVRMMLAGATGIDLALLVVAADDSVKPQTREHFEILRMLEVPAGVIALSKCDLAEEAWLGLVETEIRALVAGSFLAQAPLVRVSSVTGQGIDDLKQALFHAADQSAHVRGADSAPGTFRLPIDRSFSIAGRGTVVTGSVVSGTASVGDELVLEPGGLRLRARELGNHGRPVERVVRGQRASINLPGIHHHEVRRGQELASPGYLVPSSLMTVELGMLLDAARGLRNRAGVRVHLGTNEIMAQISLLSGDTVEPGGHGFAQLFLSQPAVATWGQAFILRTESPLATIGGGHVLDPAAAKLSRRDEKKLAWLAPLAGKDLAPRTSAAIRFFGCRRWQPHDLARQAAIFDPAPVLQELIRSGELIEIRSDGNWSPCQTGGREDHSILLHREVIDELMHCIETRLGRMHDQRPLQLSIDRRQLMARLEFLADRDVLDAIFARLIQTGRIQQLGSGVALAGRGPKLSTGERELLLSIISAFQGARFQPPSLAEITTGAMKNKASVPQLLRIAIASGQLVEIHEGLHLHAEVESELRQQVRAALEAGPLTVSQIRDLLGTTRKFAVPICEYLDRIGLTRRDGDLRYAGDLVKN